MVLDGFLMMSGVFDGFGHSNPTWHFMTFNVGFGLDEVWKFPKKGQIFPTATLRHPFKCRLKCGFSRLPQGPDSGGHRRVGLQCAAAPPTMPVAVSWDPGEHFDGKIWFPKTFGTMLVWFGIAFSHKVDQVHIGAGNGWNGSTEMTSISLPTKILEYPYQIISTSYHRCLPSVGITSPVKAASALLHLAVWTRTLFPKVVAWVLDRKGRTQRSSATGIEILTVSASK